MVELVAGIVLFIIVILRIPGLRRLILRVTGLQRLIRRWRRWTQKRRRWTQKWRRWSQKWRRWSQPVAAILIFPLLAGLLIGWIFEMQRTRNEMKAIIGAVSQDNQWSFGQIVAVFLWVPLCFQILFHVMDRVWVILFSPLFIVHTDCFQQNVVGVPRIHVHSRSGPIGSVP